MREIYELTNLNSHQYFSINPSNADDENRYSLSNENYIKFKF